MKVKDLMTSDPAKIGPDDGCAQAAVLMREEGCGSIPVVREGVLVGIVTDRDIVIRAVADGRDTKTTPVSEVMSADPITIGPESDIEQAVALMAERQVRRLPVVENGRLFGIIATAQRAP